MSESLRKVGRQAPIYMVGVGLNRLAGFVMLPIYTSYLTTEDYGVLELLSLTVDFVGTVAMVGLAAGIFKFHAEYDSIEEKQQVLSTAALSIMFMTSLIALIGFVFAVPISEVVLRESGLPIYFQIFFFVYLFQQWQVVPKILLRLEDRPWTFVAVGLTRLVSMLSLNIWLLVYRDAGVVGVLISNLLTSSILSFVLLGYLFRSTGIRFSTRMLGRMVKFGAPMTIWFLGNFVLVFSDRYFLNHYYGMGDVGLYSLAAKFTMLISAVAYSPFHQVWDPVRFRLAKSDPTEAPETFTRVFVYLNIGLGLFALGISLFARDVITLMADPAFHGAHRVVPILAAAQIIYHWVQFSNFGLLLRDATSTLGLIAVVSVIVALILNMALVPRYGISGAAFASLGAYCIRFALVLRASQKLYRIRYEWGRVAAIYGIVAAAIVAKYAAVALAGAPSPTVGGLILTLAVLATYRLVLREKERTWVSKVVLGGRDRLNAWVGEGGGD